MEKIKDALKNGITKIRMDNGKFVEAVLVDDLPKIFEVINTQQFEEKKDRDEAQNVSLSGDTKQRRGKKINIEQMPVCADNHLPAENIRRYIG